MINQLKFKQWPLFKIFVIKNLKILYCPIAKNANSSLKRLMVSISDLPHKEQLLKGDIHLNTDMPTSGVLLGQLDEQTIQNIISDSAYLRFAILRDPLARLVSVYWEKFVLHRTNLRQHQHIQKPIWYVQQRQGASIPDFQKGISFEDFIKYIVSQPVEKQDIHWCPQYLYLQDLEYNALYRLETPNLFMERLQQHTGLSLELPRYNMTQGKHKPFVEKAYQLLPEQFYCGKSQPSVECFYSDKLYEVVRNYFEKDFSIIETLKERDASNSSQKSPVFSKNVKHIEENISPSSVQSKCRICHGQLTYKWSLKVLLDKYKADYFECEQCHTLQIAEPFWLDEAYSLENAITLDKNLDKHRFGRNYTTFLYLQALQQTFLIPEHAKVIDFGGGYGLLTSMLRESNYDAWTFDAYINEPLLAGTFHINAMDKIPEKSVDVITALEVLEHLAEPNALIEDFQRILKPSGILMISTCIYKPEEHNNDWVYLVPETGQHITFWTEQGIQQYAQQLGFNSALRFPVSYETTQQFSIFVFSFLDKTCLYALLKKTELLLKQKDLYLQATAYWDASGVQRFITGDLPLIKIVKSFCAQTKYVDAAQKILEAVYFYGWNQEITQLIEHCFIPLLDINTHLLPVEEIDYKNLLHQIVQGKIVITELCSIDDAPYLTLETISLDEENNDYILTIEISNNSNKKLKTDKESQNPIYISYRWLDDKAQKTLYEGQRYSIEPNIKPQQKNCYNIRLTPPQQLSTQETYTLRLTLVQEGISWFDNPKYNLYDDILIFPTE